MMLGFEPASKGIMERKPRETNEKFFNKFLIARIVVPAIIKAIFISSTYFVLENTCGHAISSTVSFIMLAMIELLFAFTVRSDDKAIWQIGIFTNPQMFLGVLAVLILQIIAVFVPVITNLLEITKLNIEQYAIAFGLPIIFFIIAEMVKILLAKVYKNK